MNRALFLLPFLLTASSISSATSLFAEAGLHIGGDDIATVTFFGGGSETVKAGELLSASIGLVADVNESFETRTSIGFKYDGVTAENGDVTFIRFPVEVMILSKGETVSFGAGISYHLGPEFSSSGIPGAIDIPFDDALGFVVEVDYKLGERGYLGIKGTAIDYDVSAPFTGSISGNSIGVVIGTRFK